MYHYALKINNSSAYLITDKILEEGQTTTAINHDENGNRREITGVIEEIFSADELN